MIIFNSNQNSDTVKPEILVSDSVFKFNLKTVLLALALLIIVGEGIWIFLQYNKPEEKAKALIVEEEVVKDPVKLSLLSPKGSFNLRESVELTIELSTVTTEVEGVDVELTYDNSSLEASKSAITAGNIFPEYPIIEVIPTQGKIRISAISDVNQNFTGTGSLAKIVFKPKKIGVTEVKFDFTAGSTTDTNVVNSKMSEDLLKEVKNISLEIK
jgi:hypothetical protein